MHKSLIYDFIVTNFFAFPCSTGHDQLFTNPVRSWNFNRIWPHTVWIMALHIA